MNFTEQINKNRAEWIQRIRGYDEKLAIIIAEKAQNLLGDKLYFINFDVLSNDLRLSSRDQTPRRFREFITNLVEFLDSLGFTVRVIRDVKISSWGLEAVIKVAEGETDANSFRVTFIGGLHPDCKLEYGEHVERYIKGVTCDDQQQQTEVEDGKE